MPVDTAVPPAQAAGSHRTAAGSHRTAVAHAPGRASVPVPAYAPFGLTHDGGRWSLTRDVVPTRHGDVVVRHRAGVAPMLFVHGAAGSWTTWTPLLTAADGFGSRGLVLVDLPGWGESAAPSVPLGVDTAAEVLLDVADALHLPTVDVIGHSMGAVVAMHLAVTAPDRVWSVALVSPTGTSAMEAARHPVRAIAALPAFGLLRAGLAVLGGAAPSLLSVLAGIGLLPLLAGPVFAHASRVHPSVLAAFPRELRPAGFLAAARAGAAYDRRPWSSITCPIVAIGGRHDAFASRSDARSFRSLVPQARRVVVPDCGHFAHVEHPALVARSLDPQS